MKPFDCTGHSVVLKGQLSEAQPDAITALVTKAIETQEEFIFQTLRPFCEKQVDMVITKEELIQALTLYREQKEKGSGWISVTERLPEETGEYIVFDGDTVFGACYEIGTSGPNWTDATEGYYEYKVTHWRPMPEPPEGVSGNA